MRKSLSVRSLLQCLAVAVLLGSMTSPCLSAGDDWIFGVEGYLWGAEVNGDLPNEIPLEITLGEIVDNLDMGFMGTFGASKGKWTFGSDLIYLDLEDQEDFVILNSTVDLDIELKAWIMTLPVAYNLVDNDRFKLDVLGGVRYLHVNLDVKVSALGGSDSFHTWDGIVGARGKVKFGEHWCIPYYADLGTGDSDYTYQVLSAVGYRFKKSQLQVGYRYLEWDFGEGQNKLLDNLNVSGPFVGFIYVFGS